LHIEAKGTEGIARRDCSALRFGNFRNSSQRLHDLLGCKHQSALIFIARCIGSSPMENLSELIGYVASTLVLLTFVAKDMRLLRTVAIFSNLAFITYGTIEWLPPVLFLHLVLLPLNIVRLSEIVRTSKLQTTSSNLTVQSVPKVCAPTY
jgi:hypothetical protein